MGLRVTEIDQQPVPHVACDKALVAFDYFGAGILIFGQQLMQLFRVKALGEGCGTYEVTEHHR